MLDSKFLSPGLAGADYQSAIAEFLDEFRAGEQLLESELVRRSGNVSSCDEEKHWP